MASKNLALGKGEIYFGKFKTGTQTPEGLRLLGNCPEFTLNMETDTLDHFNSMASLREQDEEIIIERRLGGSIVCEDMSSDNVALFFMGAASTQTQVSATGTVNTFVDVVPGQLYQLGVSAANPTGVRKVSAVVVEVGVTAKTLGTDYLVDLDLGLVTIVKGGTIVAGDDVEVTFNTAAATRQRIISGDELVEGELKFISYNPKGDRTDYTLPWVKIRSNGDFSLISEEWVSLPFTIKALVKTVSGTSLALLYADGRAVV